jgi:hypothetical protein
MIWNHLLDVEHNIQTNKKVESMYFGLDDQSLSTAGEGFDDANRPRVLVSPSPACDATSRQVS